jgi:hypothetical protein
LARIAPLPRAQKYTELERLNFKRPPYTYKPVRLSDLDILNVAPGPLADKLPRTPWPLIEREIARRCGSTEEKDANLRVGEGLYNYADEHSLRGARYPIAPLAMGLTHKIVYWCPAVLEIDGRMCVPFIDHRRTAKMTALARQFTFSAMQDRMRGYLDLADAVPAIFQFENSDKGPRNVIPYFADGIELFTYDQLESMVRETYEIWREILQGRRDRPTGTTGLLGI